MQTDASRLDTRCAIAVLTLLMFAMGTLSPASALDKSADAAIREIQKEAKRATTDSDVKALGYRLLKISDDAIGVDNYTDATRALTLAADYARKSGNRQLAFRVRQKVDDVKVLAKEFKSIVGAIKKLESTPEDTTANRTVGLFRSAGQGQWGVGAKMLEKSGEIPLIAAGRGESSEPTSISDQAALGKNWKDAAETDPTWQRGMLQRAHYWYAKAFRNATDGKEREALYDHLSELPLMYLSDMNEEVVLPGPWPVSKYGQVGNGQAMKVDGLPYELGIGMHSAASARFRPKGQYRSLNLGCAVNDLTTGFDGKPIFEVYGDGNLLWRSAPVETRNDAEFATINVKGVQTIELRTKDGGSGAHTVWLDPYLSK